MSNGTPTTGPLNVGPRYDELIAEVERLRAQCDELRKDLEIWRRNGGDDLMRAEIARLRDECAITQLLAKRDHELHRLHMAQLEDQCAELLAALRFYGYDGNWNSSEMDGDGGELARAAITKAEGK